MQHRLRDLSLVTLVSLMTLVQGGGKKGRHEMSRSGKKGTSTMILNPTDRSGAAIPSNETDSSKKTTASEFQLQSTPDMCYHAFNTLMEDLQPADPTPTEHTVSFDDVPADAEVPLFCTWEKGDGSCGDESAP